MKIGLFTDGYLPQINGVATSVEELEESLTDRGHDVYIVAPKFPHYKDEDENVFRLKSIRLYKNPELRLSYMWPDKIFQKVLKINFDVFHGFSGGSIPALGLALAKFKRKPYVFTYNTRLNHYTHYFLKGKVIRPKAVEKVVELYCNVCNHVVAPAQYVKDELIKFGVKKPITVIPNGINTKRFKIDKSTFLKDELNLPDSSRIIVYVGRVAKEKSIDFLLKTFEKLLKEEKNIYFAIVGDGPERKNLEKLSEKLELKNKVFFLGFVDHRKLSKVYNGADVFAFASTTETQGLVVLEAMACGLPVVAIRDKVFDAFIENGVDGYMVEKKESVFATKLMEVLNDKKVSEEVGQKARAKSEMFSLEEIAKKFETLYNSL